MNSDGVKFSNHRCFYLLLIRVLVLAVYYDANHPIEIAFMCFPDIAAIDQIANLKLAIRKILSIDDDGFREFSGSKSSAVFSYSSVNLITIYARNGCIKTYLSSGSS